MNRYGEENYKKLSNGFLVLARVMDELAYGSEDFNIRINGASSGEEDGPTMRDRLELTEKIIESIFVKKLRNKIANK